AGLDHPPAAGAHHRAGARAADARLAEGVRPDLPDDRRRARGRYPADPAVRLRGPLHRLPPGLRLGHLVHLLLPDHHRLHRVHGDLVPTEREGSAAAANPVTPPRPAEAAASHVATPTPSRRRRTLDPFRVLAFVILAVLALAWLVPVAWAVLTSLKTEAEAAAMPVTLVPDSGFTLSAYKETLSEGKVPRWACNSLLTSSLVTAITVVISALAGYALSRMTFTGRRLIITLTVASIMIPSQILIVPLFKLMLSLDLVDTYWGIILPRVVAAPMVFILMKFFDQIPKELEEAALMDGASRLRILWSIIVPLSRPILGAVAIFVFIGAWNNFLWPFIVINDADLMTIPVGLQTVISAYCIQYAQNMAQAVLAALPLIVVFLFFQRQIIKGISTTGIAGT